MDNIFQKTQTLKYTTRDEDEKNPHCLLTLKQLDFQQQN